MAALSQEEADAAFALRLQQEEFDKPITNNRPIAHKKKKKKKKTKNQLRVDNSAEKRGIKRSSGDLGLDQPAMKCAHKSTKPKSRKGSSSSPKSRKGSSSKPKSRKGSSSSPKSRKGSSSSPKSRKGSSSKPKSRKGSSPGNTFNSRPKRKDAPYKLTKPKKPIKTSKPGINFGSLSSMGNYLGGEEEEKKNSNNSNTNSSNASKPRSKPKNNKHRNNVNSGKLQQMLGNTFVTNNGKGNKTFAQGIAPNAVIGLYFSASWCGPCRQFTANNLKPTYAQWKRQKKNIEIVFVSGDRDNNAFKDYFNHHHGAWLAIPFGSPQIEALKMQFSVRGIPKLVFVDSNGIVIDANGRQLVQSMGAGAADQLMKNVPDPAPAFQGTAFSLKDDKKKNRNRDDISIYDYIPEKRLSVDGKKELATLQIVTLDGKEREIGMNLTQTVGDLFGHVKALHNPGKFKLMEGYPPKELKDETMTVQEACLHRTKITQMKM